MSSRYCHDPKKGMPSVQGDAIVTAISIKNRSIGYYRAVSSKVTDTATKKVFGQLAREESEHLESICSLFHGDDNELVRILNANNIQSAPYYSSLLATVDGESTDFEALRIALKVEQSCLEWMTIFADIIREPHIRDVFSRILNETNRHGDMIQSEYTRLITTQNQKMTGSICT